MTDPQTPVAQGRPRPAEALNRDNRVLAILDASRNAEGAPRPLSRADIEDQLGETGNKVWLSLDRLHSAGLAVKDHRNRWSRTDKVDDRPQPAAAPEAPAA